MTARRPYASRGVPHRPRTRSTRPSRLPFAAASAAILLVFVCGGAALALGVGHSAGGPASGTAALTGDGPLMATITNPSDGTWTLAGVAQDGVTTPRVTAPGTLTRPWTGVTRGTGPEADLAIALDADLAGVDGQVAVAVKDLATGRGAIVNADQEQPAASLYKLEVLYSVFDLGLGLAEPLTITQDALSYDTGNMELGVGETLTVAETLERMVVLSDNTSGVMLGSRVGGTRINSLMANMGLDATHYGVERMTSSASDMLALVESMARGRAVSSSASADMIHLLLRQRVNDRLPRLLPAGVQVAHKTGNLPGVVNDVGLLYGPTQTIAVAAMIADTADEAAAATAIARVADTAYRYFANAPVDARRPTVPPAPSRTIPPVWREPRPVPTATQPPTPANPALGATAPPPRDLAAVPVDTAGTATPPADVVDRTLLRAATNTPTTLPATPAPAITPAAVTTATTSTSARAAHATLAPAATPTPTLAPRATSSGAVSTPAAASPTPSRR